MNRNGKTLSKVQERTQNPMKPQVIVHFTGEKALSHLTRYGLLYLLKQAILGKWKVCDVDTFTNTIIIYTEERKLDDYHQKT